ncbi:MAG: VWA domain-containing protein [Anaerolineaceae bacterium]|nr:VWA domain-containing protein [Anaerolineaceae bacterium]
MTFMWPFVLWLLVLIPLLGVGYVLLQRRRSRMLASSGGAGLLQGMIGRGPGARRHIPIVFFLIGLAILIVGMARPQAVVNLPRVEGTVILAFDVSGSMAATDLKPTRMDAAKAAARLFVARQPLTVQIGVVGFSDSGFAEQAPTNDRQSVLDAINRLKPLRGTSVANGIIATLNTVAQASEEGGFPSSSNTIGGVQPTLTPSPTPVPKGYISPVVVILLSDGENNETPDPMAAAQSAANQGIRIYTVGIGTAAGTVLHINGFNVFTQLDEATLQQIAQITGGTYFNAQSTQDLLKIYNNLDPQLIVKPEKTEVTALFAGASILVMLIGGILSLLWFSRMP